MQLSDVNPYFEELKYYKSYPYLAKKLGGRDEALFVTYILAWMKTEESFIYKSIKTIEEELEMKRKTQERVITVLARRGFLETKLSKTKYAKVRHFRINIKVLNDWIDGQKAYLSVKSAEMKRRWLNR